MEKEEELGKAERAVHSALDYGELERLGLHPNVNGLAQAAGCAALSDSAHLKTTLEKLTIERRKFFHALANSGLHVLPSYTHFCLVDVEDAQHVRQQLLTRKLLVRDCTSFGLPQPVETFFEPIRQKVTVQRQAQVDGLAIRGLFAHLQGQRFRAYQLHLERRSSNRKRADNLSYPQAQ